MPFSTTRGYKMEGIQDLITHLEILSMEKLFSELGDYAKELSDRPCLIWFGFVGSFYSPAGFPKAEVLLSCPCMCLALIAVLAAGQRDSVCERANKWGSLQLGRSSVLVHQGLWRRRMGLEMNQNVGASEEPACSCKSQLFRTWFAGCGTACVRK